MNKRKLYKPLYCGSGEPSYYVVCPSCKRGIFVTKYGVIKRHYKGSTKIVCNSSGKLFK